MQGLDPRVAQGFGDYLLRTTGANAPFIINFFIYPGADCVASMSRVVRYYDISLSYSHAVGYLAAYLGAVLSMGLLALLLAARRCWR